jgi:hypothetical protein
MYTSNFSIPYFVMNKDIEKKFITSKPFLIKYNLLCLFIYPGIDVNQPNIRYFKGLP